jgi:hypothetical protein
MAGSSYPKSGGEAIKTSTFSPLLIQICIPISIGTTPRGEYQWLLFRYGRMSEYGMKLY